MTDRVKNVLSGVLALAIGAAGGAWVVAGARADAPVPPAASETVATETHDHGAAAAPKADGDCCRKGAKGAHAKCNHGAATAGAAKAPECPRHKTAAKAAATQDEGTKAADAKAAYVCPMHPEVTSANKEDRCPKCGMFLEAATK